MRVKNQDSILEKLFLILPQAKRRLKDKVIEVNFVSDKQMKEINARYHGEDKVTDVLSFYYGPDEPVTAQVVIAKSHAKKSDFLFAHAVLHLSGLDHQKAVDRKKMDALTQLLLLK